MMCVRACLKTALPAIGFTAAFWPLAMWYFRRLADGGDEPFGLIILLLTAVFIGRNQAPLHRRPLVACLLLIIYAITASFLPPMLRCVPALLAISFYYGWQCRPGWLALLTLSLPVVSSMQFYLGYPMRLVSAEITSWLLQPFVDGLIREGTTLSAHGKMVGVDAPCSGIRMLWAGLVLGNIIASLTRMNWTKMIGFNLLTITLIILSNSLRATLLYAPESGWINIPEWAHFGAGIFCYLMAAGILIKVGTLTSRKLQTRIIS